jgi:hypothetical protein
MSEGIIAICNRALDLVKGERITALDGSSEAARLCERNWDSARRIVFEEHNWNACLKRVSLAPLSQAPAFEYTNQYQLPSDCIRVLKMYGNETEPYQIEGRYLLTNVNPVNLVYVADITDPLQYTPMLKDVIAHKLASDICFAMTGSGAMARELDDRYQRLLAEARSIDASQGETGLPYVADSWFITLMGN